MQGNLLSKLGTSTLRPTGPQAQAVVRTQRSTATQLGPQDPDVQDIPTVTRSSITQLGPQNQDIQNLPRVERTAPSKYESAPTDVKRTAFRIPTNLAAPAAEFNASIPFRGGFTLATRVQASLLKPIGGFGTTFTNVVYTPDAGAGTTPGLTPTNPEPPALLVNALDFLLINSTDKILV